MSARQMYPHVRCDLARAVNFLNQPRCVQQVERRAAVAAVGAIGLVVRFACLDLLDPYSGVRKSRLTAIDDAASVIEVQMREHDPVDVRLRDPDFGQPLFELRLALETVEAALAIGQVVAEATAEQAPRAAVLDEHDMRAERHGVVLGGRVARAPARARHWAEHTAAVEPEAASVQPVQPYAAEV